MAGARSGRADLGGDPASLRLVAARARAVERMPYLASALYAMRPVRTAQVSTCAVDARWRLYWNPAWTLQLDTEQLAGVWLHEAGHLLRESADRFRALAEPPWRRMAWNVATDAAINEDLRDAGQSLPEGVLYVELIPGGSAGMTAEELFRLLKDAPGDAAVWVVARRSRAGDGEPGPAADGQAPVWDCGSGADGAPRAWDLPDRGDDLPRRGGEGADPGGPGDAGGPGDPGEGDGGVDPGRAERIRWQVAQEVRAAARAMGDVPGGMARWAEELLEPRVDWRAELESAVRRTVASVAGVRDYTYSRPSRRAPVARDVVLPAMRRPRPPDVTVVVDTSGSMSADLLAQCLAEVTEIVRRSAPGGHGVRLVACDAGPGEVRRLRSVASVADLVLAGGGGTDLRPAIREVATMRPLPDLVVVLTDGDTPWDAVPPAGNAGASYLAVLVAGPRPAVPDWWRVVVADP
jgi:predicted metal-dependent peptidase